MWRSAKLKKRPAVFTLYLALRSFFLSGPVFIFEFFHANPLLVITLGALWVISWDWKLLIIGPLAVACNSFMAVIVGHCTRTTNVLRQVEDFYDKHGHRKFTPLTTADYLEALYQSSPEHQGKKDDEFADSMLSKTEYFLADFLRFVVVEKGENSGLGVLITFMVSDRAWIFLDTSPRNMKASKHFTVLHEVGHTEMFGLLGYAVKLGSRIFLYSLPIIILMLKWEASTAIILAALLAMHVWTGATTDRFQSKHLRFFEEMSADIFAFERCPKHWFQHYTAQDIEDVATALCMNAPSTGGQSGGWAESDEPLADEQVEWRRRTFAHNVKRVLAGLHPVTDDTVPLAPMKRFRRQRLLQLSLMTGLLVALGLQHSELTPPRFVGLIVMISLVTLAGMFVSQYATAMADYWDVKFGFKNELGRGRRSNLRAYTRFYNLRRRLKAAQDVRIDREQLQASLEDADVDENFVPPGVTGTLFAPDELDLLVDKVKAEASIFHGKVIDYNISHLEYYSANHSIVVVMNDSTRLDLGVKLQWLIRPHFIKATEVRIIRTENRVAVDGVTVPLRKGV